MKRFYLFLLGILLSINISAQTTLTTAVDFSAIDCHGNPVHLFEILDRGQYVLIDFFYTTCGPCQAATPKIVESYSYFGCNEFDVYYMEITPYDNNASCMSWCNSYGIEYPTIGTNGGGQHSGPQICNMYGIPAYPTVILIAPNRTILENDIFPISSAQTIINALSSYGIQQHECGSGNSCPAPTNLTATAGSNYVNLTWNAAEGATSYKVYKSGNAIATVSTTAYTHENLNSGNHCYVVKSVCPDGESSASNEACATVEIIPEDCYPPTNLTATADDNNNITLSWTAPAAKRGVLLVEDFENVQVSGIPAGWTVIDADGDGQNWYCQTNSGDFPPHSGVNSITSASYSSVSGALNPDNYLVTPYVGGATSVNYWACAQDANYPYEHYAVMASLTGTNASDFTIIFEETMTAKALGNWYERNVELPAGTKYVAFRHFDTYDQFRINLDDITVYGEGGGAGETVYRLYRGAAQIATTTETTYTDENLTPADYCYTVKTICVGGMSEASNEACATIAAPPEICDAPINLTADVTNNTVSLNWEMPAAATATIILEAHDVWGDGTGYQILLDPTCTTWVQHSSGNLSCGMSYDPWAYTIPTNANASDNFVVIDGSESIEIPAGNYDYLVVNPGCVSFATIYVASGQCDASRGNSVTFEAGKTYHFVATLQGSNDCITITTTDTKSAAGAASFNVYRDAEVVATGVTAMSYADQNVPFGDHCYNVSAVCESGEESELSEEACVNVVAINELSNNLSVFPNPADSKVVVRGENMEQIAIFNVLGQMVEQFTVSGSEAVVSTSRFENGIYMIRITAGDGSMTTRRVVVAH